MAFGRLPYEVAFQEGVLGHGGALAVSDQADVLEDWFDPPALLDERPVLELQMEMRLARVSRIAAKAQNGALLGPLAHFDAQRSWLEVSVGRVERVGVFDDHDIADRRQWVR